MWASTLCAAARASGTLSCRGRAEMTLIDQDTRLIHCEQRDDVAYLTLDRPPLNVMTIAMMGELIATLETLAGQPALRAVVIRGAGKAFSAGVDIGEHQGETLRPLLDAFHRLILTVLRSPLPVVSVVHGFAFGG